MLASAAGGRGPRLPAAPQPAGGGQRRPPSARAPHLSQHRPLLALVAVVLAAAAAGGADAAGVEGADVDPPRRAPLLALGGGAAAVGAGGVLVPVWLEAVEEQRVALDRLDRQPALGALRPLVARHLGLRVGEHRLAALLGRGQVHEHRGHALPAALGARVVLVVKVVGVRLVLLAVHVLQDLQRLAVFLRDHGHQGEALLDARHHLVLRPPQEHAAARAHAAVHALPRLVVHHRRLGQLRRGQRLEVLALLVAEEVVVQEGARAPRNLLHAAAPRLLRGEGRAGGWVRGGGDCSPGRRGSSPSPHLAQLAKAHRVDHLLVQRRGQLPLPAREAVRVLYVLVQAPRPGEQARQGQGQQALPAAHCCAEAQGAACRDQGRGEGGLACAGRVPKASCSLRAQQRTNAEVRSVKEGSSLCRPRVLPVQSGTGEGERCPRAWTQLSLLTEERDGASRTSASQIISRCSSPSWTSPCRRVRQRRCSAVPAGPRASSTVSCSGAGRAGAEFQVAGGEGAGWQPCTCWW